MSVHPLRRVLHSAVFYPITSLYGATVIVAFLIVQNVFSLSTGLFILGLVAIVALLMATRAELAQVHTLVNSQRDELLARIDQLAQLLNSEDITFPAPGRKERDARETSRASHADADADADADAAATTATEDA